MEVDRLPPWKANLSLAALIVALTLTPAQATWFGENVDDGADIMMMDLRYPWWAESTYNAHWNFTFDAPGNFSGYGGFTMGVESVGPDHRPNFDPEVQAAFRPGAVWSFWGSNAAGEPSRVVATSEFNYPRQYIGEGASGSLGGPCWPVIKQGRWYTMLLRVWTPLHDPHPQHAYVGRWVKDVEAGRWYLYGIVRLPTPATSFKGNGGFLEDFAFAGRSVRALHRRHGYYRKEGVWKPSNTVFYEVPIRDTYWVVEKIEDETVLAMELSSDRSLLPQKLNGTILESGRTHRFTVKQPDGPTVDPTVIDRVEAQANGEQVLVSWVIPHWAAPQLDYCVEVFNNPDCIGEPVARREARMPTTRAVLVAAACERPTVRVSITDIFDQRSAPAIVQAATCPPPVVPPRINSEPGIAYEFFVKEQDRHANVLYPPSDKGEQNRAERHFWVSLDEIADGRRVQQGTTHGFNVDLRGSRKEGYAFRFRGLLQVPCGGIYLFHMKGTDGYRITMDGQDALVWDGLHGPTEKTFWLNMARGDHPFTIDYFVDKQEPFFSLEWEGPGLPREKIPREALRHEAIGATPSAMLTAEAVAGGVVHASCDVEPNGHTIDRVQLFLGTMQVATSRSGSLTYSGLLPAGQHELWLRIWYDDNHTWDSSTVPITVDTAAVEDWKLGVAGEMTAKRNLRQTGPGAFTFVGEGEYVVYRDMEGDFTLTCRIDECLGMQGEPVNAGSWVGLAVREWADRNNYGWGRRFGIMQTARNGMRTTPDWSDGGTSRLSVQEIPAGRPWIRVVRQGSLWSAWTSTDGSAWQCSALHYMPFSEAVGAGVVFRALPQNAQMYFRASVSNVSLVAGVPDDFVLPQAASATGTDDVTLTGVVVAPSDPQVVVVRSSDRGLLRSTDGGATWAAANGDLTGAANAVRSVAIHPTHPEIMIRAAGRADHHAGNGLYRTHDGGASWTRMAFPGDFDGAGPSALCGEVITYHPREPNVVVVGCETKGLFRSDDGGHSWKQVLPEGQRFMAVKSHPTEISRAGDAVMHALTCPDRFITLLGRGPAAMATSASLSRDYISMDSGRSFRKQSERTDMGLLNLAFSDPSHGTFEIGSTHGLLHTFSAGRESYLFSEGVAVESFRPVTALAAGKIKDQSWPRVYVQALNPEQSGRVSRCDYARDVRWRWSPLVGGPSRVFVAISPGDLAPTATGRRWWVLCGDGLYRLDHQEGSFRRVLVGRPISTPMEDSDHE